jgi:hypothetical protein
MQNVYRLLRMAREKPVFLNKTNATNSILKFVSGGCSNQPSLPFDSSTVQCLSITVFRRLARSPKFSAERSGMEKCSVRGLITAQKTAP